MRATSHLLQTAHAGSTSGHQRTGVVTVVSYSTSARIMLSDTDAFFTPAIFRSAFSTAVEQAEQCIPSTSNRTTCNVRFRKTQRSLHPA